MDEINIIQQFVEHVEASIDANKFTIDTILETSIPALFIKAKIDKDPFTQGIYKTLWVRMLEKERDYLSGINFSDLRESRLLRINAKLKDFQNWANQDLVIEIKPLEPLTDEQKQDYYSRAAWSWAEAIYILQGYKPAFQLNTEQMCSHFPDKVAFFADSFKPGRIDKMSRRAGVKTFIDTPANWKIFWQGIIGNQSKTGGNAGADSKERDLTKWIRQTWIEEGKPGGTEFFDKLKKYKGAPGSPIVEHYTTGKNGAGVRWNTGNSTSTMTKKTIQTKVSKFKNNP